MADGTNTLPDAFASPTPGTKYALKQVYRDPIARKAYVFFIDANTGSVLNSLDGYTLWEAGLGVGKPDGVTGGTPAPAQQEDRFADPNNSTIRNDGFDNPMSGFNVDNLYGRRGGEGNNNPVTANPNYQWEVDTFRTPSGPAFANDQTFGRIKSNEGTFLANAPTTLEKSYTAGALSRSLDPNTLSGQSQGFSLPGGMPSAQPTVSGTGGYVGSPSSKGLGDISDDYVMTVAAETAVNDYRGATLVASVMENRAKATGSSIQSVIAAPNQFEGYGVRGKYGPGTPQYEMAMKAIMDVRTNGTKTPAMYFATPSATNNLLAGTPNASLQKVDTAVNHVFYTDAKNAPIVTAEGTKQVNPEALAPVGNVPGVQQQAQPQSANPQNFDAKTTPSFTAPTRDQSIGFGISQPAQSTQVANIAPQEKLGLTQVQPSFVNPGSVYGPQPAQTSYNPSDLAALGGTGRIGTATNAAGGRTSYAIESQAQEKNRAYDVATGRASNVPNNVTSGAWGTSPVGDLSFAAQNVQSNLSGKQRSEMPNDQILGIADMATKNVLGNDWVAVVQSGKEPKGIAAVGASNRHPAGLAGDYTFFNPATKEVLRDPAKFQAIAVEANRIGGALGIGYVNAGYGRGYMGEQTMHLDVLQDLAPGQGRSWSEAKPWEAAMQAAYEQGRANPMSAGAPGTKGFYDQPMSFNAPGYAMPNTVDMVRDTLAAGPMASKSFDGTFATPQSAAEGFNKEQAIKDWSSSVYVEADEFNMSPSGIATAKGNISVVVPDVAAGKAVVIDGFNGVITYDSNKGKYEAVPAKGDMKAAAQAQAMNIGGILSNKSSLEGAQMIGQFLGVATQLGIGVATGGIKIMDNEDAFGQYGKGITEALQKNQSILEGSAITGARPDLDHYDKTLKEIESRGTNYSTGINSGSYFNDIPSFEQDRGRVGGVIDISLSALQENNAVFGAGAQKPSYDFAAKGPNLGNKTGFGTTPVGNLASQGPAANKSITEALFDSLSKATEGLDNTFGSYTTAGKTRSIEKQIEKAMPAGVYGFTKDGMPMSYNDPSYGFASIGPNFDNLGTMMSGVSEINPFDPAGVGIGYDNRDYGLGGRSAGSGGPTRNSLSEMAGSGFTDIGRGVSGGRQNTPSITSGNDYSSYDWSGGYTGRDARDSGRSREFDSPRESVSSSLGSGGGFGGLSSNGGGNSPSPSGGSGGFGGPGPASGSGGFSGGGTPDRGGEGAGGRGGSSPSTGSGGSGSQGGPGPASGSGGFSSGSSSGGGRGSQGSGTSSGWGGQDQGGYNGTDGGRR